MIHARYPSFGATVTDEAFTLSYDLCKYIQRGRRQKNGNRIIRGMLTFAPDQEYTRQELLQAAGLNVEQYKQAVDDSPVLKQFLDQTRIPNRRKYKNALNAVLTDPELVERIRRLLDADEEVEQADLMPDDADVDETDAMLDGEDAYDDGEGEEED